MLNVARSGYQRWLSGNANLSRKQEDGRLTSLIRIAHARGRGIYGALKIQTELKTAGVEVGINRIKHLRKAAGTRCIHKRKFRVTTDSKHTLPIAPNLLNREFNQTTAPNQVWVTDITYVPTDEGWLYLAAVKDLHTCEIVGWAMDERMTKQLVCDALHWLVDEKQIEPHVPVWEKSQRDDGSLSSSDFQWHAEANEYRCPQGKSLRMSWREYKMARSHITKAGSIFYRSSV